MNIKNIMLVFGTRPEAIKMAPVILALKDVKEFKTIVVSTGQHREMLKKVLENFSINVDVDLNLMQPNQSLASLSSSIFSYFEPILLKYQPDIVLVHGDTLTSMIISLVSYYNKTKVGHVEAGLRTHNKFSPFPEEMNRQLTGKLADLHFCPTTLSQNHLMSEGIDISSTFVTGNTVIDALLFTNSKLQQSSNFQSILEKKLGVNLKRKFVLITGHRRENFGDNFKQFVKAIKFLAKYFKNYDFIYPVHLNPNVQNIVYKSLANFDNIILINPLDYEEFVFLMSKAFIILTDSGGVQEEAPSFGVPVLVMRDTTERPEAVEAGTCKLIGMDYQNIVDNVKLLINSKNEYAKMANAVNPFGNGTAANSIIKQLKRHLLNDNS